MKKFLRNQKGFTLIEILLVVAAIAILAGIVIVAINPAKQLGDTRNASREAAVNTILNAVTQYSVDNNGILPAGITATTTEICSSAVATSSCTGLVDLSVLTTAGKYVTAIPDEPQKTNVNGVGYTISKNVNGRITVTASFPESGKTISVTR
jgi:prepilin-type N-terminal cleavage/methylation domain-containing protein